MRPRTEYHDARRMLIKLLVDPDDGPVDKKSIYAICDEEMPS